MASFVIALKAPHPAVSNRIKGEFAHFAYSDTLFFVSSNKRAEEIARVVGLSGADRISNSSGLVAKLNGSYAGHTVVSLWDWLEISAQEG